MEKIEIQGYKSIKNISLPMQSINILIGANGSGKSNFLSFFSFLENLYKKNLREYVALKGIDTFLHKGSKTTQEISVKLYAENEKNYTFTLKKGESTFIFTKEELEGKHNLLFGADKMDFFTHPTTESNFRIPFDNEDIDSKLVKISFEKLENSFFNFKKYHFHDTGENSPFSQESNIENDIFYLYEKGNNLAAFLYEIREKHPLSYQLIVKSIQSIAPYFLDFFLQPNGRNNLKLRWQSRYSDTVYGVNDLSDGTIRFIALTILFLQPNLPKMIIIDEPELGLHPAAIAKLSGFIKSVANKGTQIILATQSTDLISHFEAEDIIAVDQIDGESQFNRLCSKDLKIWLEDYTIDDLWKRNIITAGQLKF